MLSVNVNLSIVCLCFSQTVEHGFPHQPSALAFDPKLQLMAIGTKSGAIKVYPFIIVQVTHLTDSFFVGAISHSKAGITSSIVLVSQI